MKNRPVVLATGSQIFWVSIVTSVWIYSFICAYSALNSPEKDTVLILYVICTVAIFFLHMIGSTWNDMFRYINPLYYLFLLGGFTIECGIKFNKFLDKLFD